VALEGESIIAHLPLPPKAMFLLKQIPSNLPLHSQLRDSSYKRIGAIRKCIKSYLTQGDSMEGDTVLPGKRLLHLKKPTV